jgi:hypothetical protein
MESYGTYLDSRRFCAFCRRPLPVNNVEVLAWRSANGQFFCTEFCADDAEEAHFQSRRRLDRQVQESLRQM